MLRPQGSRGWGRGRAGPGQPAQRQSWKDPIPARSLEVMGSIGPKVKCTRTRPCERWGKVSSK